MICFNCGEQLKDGARFCSACGIKFSDYPTKTINNSEKIQLRCKSCNGTLIGNANSPILQCPFCGSPEIIVESDLVKTQRIKSNEHITIEKEKINYEREKRSTLSAKAKILLVAGAISLIVCLILGIIASFVEDDDTLVLIIGMIAMGWMMFGTYSFVKYVLDQQNQTR